MTSLTSSHGPIDGADYWLAHCDGFRVEGPAGKLGIVEAVHVGPDGDAESVLVLGGPMRSRRWLVPIEDIAVVLPRRERVALVDAPAHLELVA